MRVGQTRRSVPGRESEQALPTRASHLSGGPRGPQQAQGFAMRWLVWILVLALVSAVAAVFFRQLRGNVTITLPPYQVEMSFHLFLLLGLALVLLVHWVIAGVSIASRWPDRVRDYRARQREQKVAEGLRAGVVAYFEGRYRRAERFAESALKAAVEQGIEGSLVAQSASLLAAQSAHALREPQRRDGWLARIADAGPLAFSRSTARLRFAVDDRRSEEAQAALAQIGREGARHVAVQRLAVKAHQMAGRHEQGLHALRLLAHRKAWPDEVIARHRSLLWASAFAQVDGDPDATRRLWKSAASSEKKDPVVLEQAARAMVAAGMHNDAADLLEALLDREPTAARYALYASCQTDARRQFSHAEAWQAKRSDDLHASMLLLQLCMRQQLWGKAAQVLEQTRLKPGADALALDLQLIAARLHDARGEADLAAAALRDAARMIEQQRSAAR